MKYIFCFVFLLIATEVYAEKVYKIYGDQEKGPFTKKCNGFCEGEDYNLHIGAAVQKTKRLINGKKKNAPKWVVYNGINIKGTVCIPFLSWNERAIPIKVKKSEQEKYMKDFREGTDMFNAHYEINSCLPCPPDQNVKKNKSGFCAIPMFYLDVVFKQASDLGYAPPMDFSEYELGREITGDINLNLKNALKGIVMEHLYISESNKTNLHFLRYINKEYGKKYIFYNKESYKTTAKQQVIKETEYQFLFDKNLNNFINGFIYNFQKNFSEVFNINGKDFKNYSKLYALIPTEDDINLFKNKFSKVAEFHIQTRN